MAHETTRLAETAPETWGNTILWKLADAMGLIQDGAVLAEVNPDHILDHALIRIRFAEENA
jgi:hypothetical protein